MCLIMVKSLSEVADSSVPFSPVLPCGRRGLVQPLATHLQVKSTAVTLLLPLDAEIYLAPPPYGPEAYFRMNARQCARYAP